jgi:hypothetical protein
VGVANVGIHSTPTASHSSHLSTASSCLAAPRTELRSARELDGMAWCQRPRYTSIKASLGTWLGSAPFRCRSTRAGQLRGSPRKTALRARATRFRRRFFAVLKTALNQVARALADDETVLRFGDFRGFAPTRIFDLGAGWTMKPSSPYSAQKSSGGSPDPSAGATGGFRLSLIPNSHDETVRIGAPAPCGCQNQNRRQSQSRLADWAHLFYASF